MTDVQIRPAPVRKSVTVKASRARAFEVFTGGIGRWWPKGHSIAGSPLQTVVIEPRAGGRWYEIGEDGSETEWGGVKLWDPPARVVLLWRLNAEWRYDAELETEVEIGFFAEDAEHTRVELEHRNLERFGDKAEAVRAGIDSPEGWGGILQGYAAVASQA